MSSTSFSFNTDSKVQGRFRLLPIAKGSEKAGVYYLVEKTNEVDDIVQEWMWLTSRVDVLAYTRDENGQAWGRLLGIHDVDGTVHLYAMPMAMMAGSGEEYRRELLDRGMLPIPGNAQKNRLGEYLSRWEPEAKARCADRVGWYRNAFVLPDRTYGDTCGERLLLQ